MSAGSLNIVTDGLVFSIDADNKVGGNITGANNLVSPTQSGSFINGTSVVNGAYSFDGVDDYIKYDYTASESMTIITIAKSNQPTWSKYGFITSDRGNNGSIIHPEFNQFGGRRVTYYVFNSLGTIATPIGDVDIDDIEQYHFYAITTDINDHKCYFDDTLINTSSASISRTSTSSTMYLASDSLVGDRYGDCKIATHMLYNRALTPAEITQNYEATKHRFE